MWITSDPVWRFLKVLLGVFIVLLGLTVIIHGLIDTYQTQQLITRNVPLNTAFTVKTEGCKAMKVNILQVSYDQGGRGLIYRFIVQLYDNPPEYYAKDEWIRTRCGNYAKFLYITTNGEGGTWVTLGIPPGSQLKFLPK